MKKTKSDVPVPPFGSGVHGLFKDIEYVLRVVVLVESEVYKFSKGRRPNFSLLESAFEYLIIKSTEPSYGARERVLLELRIAHPKYVPLIDESLIDHQEIIGLARSLLAELQADVKGGSTEELQFYFEKLQEYCERQQAALVAERAIVARSIALISITGASAAADPVFGEKPLARFTDLHNAYLDSAKRISIGNVPYVLFELAPSVSERIAYTGMELTRLPKRLYRTTRVQMRKQRYVLRKLARTRNAPDLAYEIKRYGGVVSKIPSAYLTEFSEAFQAIEAEEVGDTDIVSEAQETFSKAASAIAFRSRRPRRAARISWQAAGLNLFLRGTIKQLMGFVGTDYADQAKGFAKRWDKTPESCEVTSVEDLGFPVDWMVNPDVGATDRVVLYLPGGGFFFPAIWAHKEILAQLIRHCRAEGCLAHYRLAPEHPFPASLDDALTAYRHLLDKGVNPKKIVVVGDSAGGGLSLSLLLALKEAGLPQPAAVGLLSPMSDLSFSGPSRASNRWLDPMLPTRRKMRGFEMYTGTADPKNPLLSPVYGEFSDCAPMFAQVGSTEILLDDTLRIAAKARKAGVEFELEIWEGMPHVWHLWSVLPETTQALKRVGAYLNEKLERAA